MARFNMADSPICEVCNVSEPIEHVLLNCVQYNSDRETLIKDIKKIVGPNIVITVKVILGGGNLTRDKNVKIMKSFEKFLCDTKLIENI